MKIGIIDYGMGNIASVSRALHRVDKSAEVLVSGDWKELEKVDRIILPGVGHFASAMERIISLDLDRFLADKVGKEEIRVLGICLGMQLLGKGSEEGGVAGLALLDGQCKLLSYEDRLNFKVPHTGWNTLNTQTASQILSGVESNDEFYFVHSYYYQTDYHREILATTNYGFDFATVIGNDTVMGVQFHPEKSYEAGSKLFKNFLA